MLRCFAGGLGLGSGEETRAQAPVGRWGRGLGRARGLQVRRAVAR